MPSWAYLINEALADLLKLTHRSLPLDLDLDLDRERERSQSFFAGGLRDLLARLAAILGSSWKHNSATGSTGSKNGR